MEQESWHERVVAMLWVGMALFFIGLGIHTAATTDGRLVVENLIQRAHAADVESLTIELLRDKSQLKAVQFHDSTTIRSWLLSLKESKVATIYNRKGLKSELLGTVAIVFTPKAAAQWHLRNQQVIMRLYNSNEGEYIKREESDVFYRDSLLLAQIRELGDSLEKSQSNFRQLR